MKNKGNGILKNVKPWIPDLCCYTPGKTISGYTKLASNENNYGPAPEVREAICRASQDVNIYPHGDGELKEKIAGYSGVGQENVILGNGSDEILDIIFKTFNGPCISFNPTYSEYRIFTEALGGKYLQSDLEKNFSFNPRKFIKAAENANISVLCSPNNPTGGVISPDDLKQVLDTGKITVVDEAYVEFGGGSVSGMVAKYENLIVIRTFSKAFALAGLRVGYALASPEAILLMDRVKPPFSVNSVALEAAEAALDNVAYMRRTVEKIRKDREKIFKALSGRFKAYPSHSNFVLADVSPGRSKDVWQRFFEKKIILRDLGRYEGFPGEYVRVSVGTSEENKIFMDALDELP